MRLKWRILLIAAGVLALGASIRPLWAQDSILTASKLWVDEKTGQVFIRPGRGRVPLKIGGAVDQQQIEENVEAKTQEQVRSAVAESQAQQQAQNVALQKQVNDIKPAWHDYMTNFQNKFRLGALAYLDYSFYTHTGFGPQFLENENPPGPGNNGFNAFDISRVYLNTYFTPTDDVTFRFTPEIYRANGANQTGTTCAQAGTLAGCSLNDTFGATTGVSSNLDGDLNVRLKYAYVQFNSLTKQIPLLQGDTLSVGAVPNVFIPWEEDFSQFRYVYLMPWNYMGFSSSQIGLQAAGPINILGTEKTYLDYGAGVYDNGNFRTQEQSDTKQLMGRLTAYPFGSTFKYQGLGITGFWNYGWGDTTPDNQYETETLKGNRAQFQRIAAIISYAAEQWNVLSEFDYGKNADQLGNQFSGSGPADAFGVPTGAPITSVKAPAFGFGNNGTAGTTACSAAVHGGLVGSPCYNIFNTYGPQTAIYRAILNNGRERNIGFDLLGHYHIPYTKLTAFGMFQWFMPNDNIIGDPLDFQRFVAGISYQYNEYVRLAVDSQNLLYYHNQFGMAPATAQTFGYVPGSRFNGWLLPRTVPTSLGGAIPNLVPRDIHTIFANLEFSY
jgi:hypothetical protein